MLSQYYGLPVLSVRSAAYPLMIRNATGYRSYVPVSESSVHDGKFDSSEFFYADPVSLAQCWVHVAHSMCRAQHSTARGGGPMMLRE